MAGYRFTPEEEQAVLEGRFHGRRADGTAIIGTTQEDGLVEHITNDRTGRPISTFTGEPVMWMRDFMSPALLQVRINAKPPGGGGH
jgi:hypothetical protein